MSLASLCLFSPTYNSYCTQLWKKVLFWITQTLINIHPILKIYWRPNLSVYFYKTTLKRVERHFCYSKSLADYCLPTTKPLPTDLNSMKTLNKRQNHPKAGNSEWFIDNQLPSFFLSCLTFISVFKCYLLIQTITYTHTLSFPRELSIYFLNSAAGVQCLLIIIFLKDIKFTIHLF